MHTEKVLPVLIVIAATVGAYLRLLVVNAEWPRIEVRLSIEY